VGPSHPAHTASTSTLPSVAASFEEAAANQAVEASQAALEPVGHEDAPGHDAIFDNEDT